MDATVSSLLVVLSLALLGGVVVRLLKLPTIVGYTMAGLIGGSFFSSQTPQIEGLAGMGLILLLFSVGLEIPFSEILSVGGVAIVGSGIQIVLVTLISFVVLTLFGIEPQSSLVLSAGFSLSSTAVVLKMLGDRGELDSIQGKLMTSWLLIQDLAVIPMVLILPLLGEGGESGLLALTVKSVLSASAALLVVFFLGRLLVPYLIHKVALLGSRELLALAAVATALGTAFLVSFFGISPALGAFLAGVVISHVQENHAIFAETRPLRDIFVILFFVTLGFLSPLSLVLSHLGLILSLALFVLTLKFAVLFGILYFLGYRGKTILYSSIGLTQIGEFSFVLYLAAKEGGIMSPETASVGIATTLLTLVATPFLFKAIVPLWRKTKHLKIFSGGIRAQKEGAPAKNQIIICGFGRVGRWVGYALAEADVPFIAIDYNPKVARQAREAGIDLIFGDPAESEVLEEAGLKNAKAVIICLPDRLTQEEVIAYTETVAPDVKIIARAHLDEDWEKLSALRVRKVVQPEFEAAVAIARDVFKAMGKGNEEIGKRLKAMRIARATKKL